VDLIGFCTVAHVSPRTFSLPFLSSPQPVIARRYDGQLTSARWVIHIGGDGRRTDDRGYRIAGAHFRSAGSPADEPERSCGCQSKARRETGAQPVVSALAAVRDLLPIRAPSTPTRRHNELDLRTNSHITP
jgi:hypothetical protein